MNTINSWDYESLIDPIFDKKNNASSYSPDDTYLDLRYPFRHSIPIDFICPYCRNKSNTDRGADQKTAYRIMYSKLALIEYDMVKKSIDDTGKLLELKLIALNKIIKDESKKHLEYLLDHSKKARMDRLKNEMIRIKTAIVINNQIATGITQDLVEFGKQFKKSLAKE